MVPLGAGVRTPAWSTAKHGPVQKMTRGASWASTGIGAKVKAIGSRTSDARMAGFLRVSSLAPNNRNERRDWLNGRWSQNRRHWGQDRRYRSQDRRDWSQNR